MRNVVITGAGGGIGHALVERFCENGDNVWACARTRKDDFENWLNTCAEKNGVWVRPVYFDLTDSADRKRGFREICKEKLPIDVLVNNAGIGHMGLFQMTPTDVSHRIYEVNLFAPMELCQLALRVMIRQKNGQIINISSTAADEVYRGNSVYGASKAALNAFTRSFAAECAPYNVRVNAIAPGLTDTEMGHIFEGDDPALPLARSAIGRKLDPKEIADAVLSLTDDKMRMVNGQVIRVNGGAK